MLAVARHNFDIHKRKELLGTSRMRTPRHISLLSNEADQGLGTKFDRKLYEREKSVLCLVWGSYRKWR